MDKDISLEDPAPGDIAAPEAEQTMAEREAAYERFVWDNLKRNYIGNYLHGMLGMTGFLLWLEFKHRSKLLVVLMVLFAGGAGFGAFPALVLPDRWFRLRERAHARWIRRHPRMAVALALLLIVGFVYRLSSFILSKLGNGQ